MYVAPGEPGCDRLWMYIATLQSWYVVASPGGRMTGRSMSSAGMTTRVATRWPEGVVAGVGSGVAVVEGRADAVGVLAGPTVVAALGDALMTGGLAAIWVGG